jgi:hypothetical protein
VVKSFEMVQRDIKEVMKKEYLDDSFKQTLKILKATEHQPSA